MISFEPFRLWAYRNNKKQKHIMEETGIYSDTIQRIFNDKIVRTETIDVICRTYKLSVSEVMEYRDEKE
ncbi:helix-turn-helix domain-containing protein [Paenibacillus melissococcoides]|uniref:helix-turn-helix domain-containing protein n=1 Tax=Paenibacillus melissococcoides TaxID=2912268 RepID=UPI0036F2180C